MALENPRILKEIAAAAKAGQEPWFLTSASSKKSGYPFDYRYILCYALRHYLLQEKATQIQAELVLTELLSALQTQKTFVKESFFSLYPLNGAEGNCFVGVDKAHGCFPLMIKGARGRVVGFEESVADIKNNIEGIFPILSRPKKDDVWSAEMQEELEAHFRRPKGLDVAA